LEEEIKKIESELKVQAKDDANEKTYKSVPGVGPQSARVLSNELGNMSQFKNERELFSYTELTPSEYSSGKKVSKGHITHQGNKYVRGILIEVA
jgi:transposase